MSESLFCIEIELPVADADTEAHIEDAIWEVGAPGVERQDDTTFSQLVEEPNPRPAGAVRWRIYMEPPEAPRTVEDAYRSAVGDIAQVRSWTLDDLSFLTNWKQFFRPTQVSPRFVVHPPWEVPEVADTVHRLQIEPGMAFGTGTHETTRLCLRAIDRLVTGPCSVFDVGCGSGVLSIAAAKLGATPVLGVDHDPIAVRASVENAEINGIEASFDANPITPCRGTFDLVVANILPHILVDLRDAIVPHVAADGVLVLSGITTEQRERVRAAYEAAGLRCEREDQDGEWWALEMVPA